MLSSYCMVGVIITFLVIILVAMTLLIRCISGRGNENRGNGLEESGFRRGNGSPFPTRKPVCSVEEAKGRAGEQTLYSYIAGTEKSGAKVLRNCWLQFVNGTVTEVDLILIYRSGIYVIESKNYNDCWIFGSEDDDQWTRTWLKKGDYEKQSRKFYNPVEQNRVHTECISDLVADIDVPIYSIIAFSDRCELKKVPPKTAYRAVINYRDLRNTVAGFLKSQPKRISDDEVNTIYNRLAACSSGVTEEEKRYHDHLIREKKEE